MGAVLCHVRPSSLTLKPRAIFTRFFPERACSQSNAGSSGACPRRILTAFIFVLAPSLLDTHCLVENLVRQPTVATTGSLAWSVLWAFSLFHRTYRHLPPSTLSHSATRNARTSLAHRLHDASKLAAAKAPRVACLSLLHAQPSVHARACTGHLASRP
jgi:hypothetical protein